MMIVLVIKPWHESVTLSHPDSEANRDLRLIDK